jgi:hypothetical protein
MSSMLRIEGTTNRNEVLNRIRQHLMYRFNFNAEEAIYEQEFLFATSNILHTADYYSTIRRIGTTKLLSRKDRQDIHKMVVAIIQEGNNKEQQF